MASIQNKQKVSDMVFDVKEKLTDEEYKNIMDGISKIDEKKYVKIHYYTFHAKIKYDDDEDGPTPAIKYDYQKAICQILDKRNNRCQYHNIKYECVLDPDELKCWKEHKDDKLYWPVLYPYDGSSYMVVGGFEEL